jgi:hypothetical protein
VSTADEWYYLAVGSQAYFNHPGKLADPVFRGDAPNLYPPWLLLPGVWAAKLLGLDPLGISLMWRILGGSLAGLAWYGLLYHKIPRPWFAASLAAILLSDPGLCRGLPFAGYAVRAREIATAPSDSLLAGSPYLHLEWRIVTPAMTMACLIALIWAVSRARQKPSPNRIILAGLVFGLLFYVYFYYWTAVGLALLLALALDGGHRRIYFHAGWIGGLIGLPAVISGLLLKPRLSPDFFIRCDRFLPIGRFTELELPTEMVLVTVLGLAWVWFRRRDLLFVWALGVAGLLIANHQLVTGLQLENWHWKYVWGPAFSCFLLLSVAEEFSARLNWSPAAGASLGIAALAAFGVGMWIRAVEGSRCIDPARNMVALAAYRIEFPPDRPSPFAANCVVAGDWEFVDCASILHNLRPLLGLAAFSSPLVSDAELEARTALNDLLVGVDRAGFAERASHQESWSIGHAKRAHAILPVRVAARLAAYDRARADLPAALDRFGVRYVALPAGRRPDYLARGWNLLVAGPTWEVWERTAASAMRAGP